MRILKWAGIILGGVIAILLIANGIWVWTTGSRLEKKLAALRAAGAPLTLADLDRDVPLEKNAAVLFRRASSDLKAISTELSSIYGGGRFRHGRLDDAELETIRSMLETYATVVPLLQQAATRPDHHPLLDYTGGTDAFMQHHLDNIGDIRSMLRVLRARVILLLSEGRQEEAIETCITMSQLGRHSEREPMIIGYLVSLVCRRMAVDATNLVLHAGPLSEESRKVIEAELALYEGAEAYRRALKTERAYGLESFRTTRSNCWLLLDALWNDATCYYLDVIDRYIALAERPYSEVAAMNLGATPDSRSFRVVVDLVIPAIRSTREAMERTRARMRCLRVLNALQGRPEQAAEETPRLSDLGLPAAATTDPFTDKPLQLKKLPRGWLVYSVGKDLKDDGGQLSDEQDVGVGPPQSPADK